MFRHHTGPGTPSLEHEAWSLPDVSTWVLLLTLEMVPRN